MKMPRNKPAVDRGSTLVVTVILCAILGVMVGSYLYLIQTQHLSAGRSQKWNQALVVAEAGVEEAMALMNGGVQGANFAVFPWTSSGPGVFKNDTNRPACKFGTSYYQVFITNAFVGAKPVILSTAYVPAPIRSSVIRRTVRVETKPRPTFPVKGPMIVLQTYNANGYNVGTDSFDSSVGPYNQNNPGTNGDVVCLTTNANSIMIGNGKIDGNVRTPPGGIQGVTATIGSNGSVGDTAWVTSQSGFEAGHFQDNFTLTEFPDAVLPTVTWYGMSGKGTVAPDGLYYDYVLTTGNYSIVNLSGSVYVGQSNVVIYVTSSINIGSGGGGTKNGYAPPEIHIDNKYDPNASLTLYMGGATASISGKGVVNDTGLAKNFAYYGLPSNTTLNLTGNGAFYGTIYAPEADFYLKGSGKSSTDDFTGASVTKTTTMTGNFNFHYDDSLIRLVTIGGYDATSWTEL